MTEREAFNLAETREEVYLRDRGRCRYCGKPVPFPGELAHRIPQTKANLKKYGPEVIHHPGNLALVCLRSTSCNDGMMVGRNKQEEEKVLSSIPSRGKL